MNTCAVCTSPKRPLVEALWLDGGHSKSSIARQTGLDRQSVNRHILRHVGAVPRGTSQPAPSTPRVPSPAPLLSAGVYPAASGVGIDISPLDAFPVAFGVDAMEWQREFLAETRNTVIRKGRQIGCSTCVAVIAACAARSRDNASIVILSPGLRQSGIIAEKTRTALLNFGDRLDRDASNFIQLPNRSRILSLPGSRKSVRGWTADLMIMDEAAYIDEATITASRALIATGGRLIVLSTPALPDGYFYRLASNPPETWASFVVRSDEVPTISPEFLASEKAAMTAPEYAREYLAEFAKDEDVAGIGLFNPTDVARMFGDEVSDDSN